MPRSPLDPGEGVLLPDGENDVVGRDELLAGDALGGDSPARVELVLHAVESHPDETAVFDDEGLGRAVDHDLDAFLLGILELPFGGLEEAARLARHHLYLPGAEPQAGAAAVHRGVADTDDEDALADPVDVAEGHRLQPIDADMDVGAAASARPVSLEVLAFGRPGADEHRIEAAAREQLAHAGDAERPA